MILYFSGCLQDLINFGLIYTFHISKLLLRGHDYTGNGAKTTGFEFSDIRSIDTMFLKLLNLNEVSLLKLSLRLFDFFFNLFLLLIFGFLSLFLLHLNTLQKYISRSFISSNYSQ